MKIPKYVLKTVEAYFDHRRNQHDGSWNKIADLDSINQAAIRANLGFEACAGTFFFSYGKKIIRINENNYMVFLLNKNRSVKRKNKKFYT